MDSRWRQSSTDKAQVLYDKIEKLENKINGLTSTVNTMYRLMSAFQLDIKIDLNTIKNETSGINNLKKELKLEITNLSNKLTRIETPKLDWKKKMNQRKFAFYDALKNNSIAEIYEKALNSENVKIPKKLFKNPVSQHSTQEKELRKEMCLKNCEYEIKRLKLVADIKNKVVKEIDDEISDFYNAHYNSEEGDRRKHRWREMVEGEEQTSKVIWQKKRSFFNSERHMISINSESKSVYKQLHSSNFHNRCMYNKKHNNVTKRNDNSNRNCRNVNYNWRVQQYND